MRAVKTLGKKIIRLLNRGLAPLGLKIEKSNLGVSFAEKPYGNIRVLSFESDGYFSKFVNTLHLDSVDMRREVETGIDFFVFEPGLKTSISHLDKLNEVLSTLEEAGIPRVAIIAQEDDFDCIKEVSEKFNLIYSLVQDLRYENSKKLISTYSIDPRIDRPVGIDFVQRGASVLVPCETKKAALPDSNDKYTYKALQIDEACTVYAPQPIKIGLKNTVFAALCLRENFTTDLSYVVTIMRLAANGVRVLVSDLELLPENLRTIFPAVQLNSIDDDIEKHLADFDTWEKTGVRQTRTVVAENSRVVELEKILNSLKISPNKQPLVSVLAATNRHSLAKQLIDTVLKQKHVTTELHLALHGASAAKLNEIQEYVSGFDDNVFISAPNKSLSLGDVLNDLLNNTNGDYIAKMDDDDYYGENHLYDLLVAHTYTDASIVGKWSNFVWFEDQEKLINWRTDKQERFVPHLPGATWLARSDVLKKYKFASVKRSVDSTLLDRLRADGHRLYSTHRFNFVRTRHDNHTYKTDHDKFMRDSDGRYYGTLDEEIYTV